MPEEEEGFLRRWARRKEARRVEPEAPEAAPAPEAPGPEDEAPAEPSAEAPVAPDADAFDPASLPPIESLDGSSDYTAFLRDEVPRALRNAALRRAWSSTGAIVAHKPLVDYDWNFNAPGYGRLRPTDDVAALVKTLFRRTLPQEEAPEPVTGTALLGPAPPEAEGALAAPDAEVPPADEAAPQDGPAAVALAPCEPPPAAPPDPPGQGTGDGRALPPEAPPPGDGIEAADGSADGGVEAEAPDLPTEEAVCARPHRRHGGAVPI